MRRNSRRGGGGNDAESAASREPGPFTITLLDVGEEQYGDAVLCRLGAISVLVDGAHPGNHRRKGGHLAIQEQIRPLLPQRDGASAVTLLVVSHAHQDHIGCLPRLVRDGHLVADWALVPDPALGWGLTGTESAALEVSPAALQVAEALREEPRALDDVSEESAFLEAARRLDDEYREMLDTLERTGTRVILFTGSDDPALQPLVRELARGGVALKLLGPTRRHVAACAEGISGNLEALSLEIDRVLEAEAVESGSEESAADAERRALEVYRRVALAFAAGSEEAGGVEAAFPRVSHFVNLQSSVFALEYRGRKLLFTGDMQLADPQTRDPAVLTGMRALLRAIQRGGPYDFVKLSHHGSHNGMSAELMELMGDPPLVGLCAGENSRFHPDEATLDLLTSTLAERGLRWARTDVNGLSTITFDEGEPAVTVSCGHLNDASPPAGRARRRGSGAEAMDSRRGAAPREERAAAPEGAPVISGPCVEPAGAEAEARVAGGGGMIEAVPGYRRIRPDAPVLPRLGARAEPGPDNVLLPAGARVEARVMETALARMPVGARMPAAARMPVGARRAVGAVSSLVLGTAPLVARNIVGEDDRRMVSRTTAPPWRAVCSLRLNTNVGVRLVGTGWLIDRRTVITAGHCVYHPQYGGWMNSVEVIPARDGEARPFGSVVGTRLRAAEGWTEDYSLEYDYGAVLLDRPVELETDFFVPVTLSDRELDGALVNIAGYPADLEDATRMFFHAREIRSTAPRMVQYEVDTWEGQSGSPAWVSLRDGTRFVVAIHTGAPDRFAPINHGTRISEEVLRDLLRWSAEAGSGA